ncbi:MAG: (2Fe-2S) ferredoxin domain-containing protein [Candidatus Omnitrophota bacterium]
MERLKAQDLKKIKDEQKLKTAPNWIRVGLSSCGIAAGAQQVFDIFSEEIKKRNIDMQVKRCGCAGMCYAEPLVEVSVKGLPTVFYGKVNEAVAVKIIEEHIINKKLVNDHIYDVNVKHS